MGTIQSRKCQSCGADDLEQINSTTLKCTHCGSTYSIKSPENPASANTGPSIEYLLSDAYLADSPQLTRDLANARKAKTRALLVISLFIFVVFIVLLVIIEGASSSGSDDASRVDSLRNDSIANSLNLGPAERKKEATEPHIKKTYPDPEIAITKHRIGMFAGNKSIFIAYRNQSKRKFEYVDFDVQLFNADGFEIAVADSEQSKLFIAGSAPGESKTDSWVLHGDLVDAKTVKVTLKKVVTDSLIWDY